MLYIYISMISVYIYAIYVPADQVPQEAIPQQADLPPARAAPEGSAVSRAVALADGTEPVDHKDPEVVEHFRRYFGVAMTFEQVMALFDKGGEPTTFVPFGKVMAFDQELYSYGDFTNFYGNVAGPEAWNFAHRVQQDSLLALHHVQNIANFLRLYTDVHPQVRAMRDSVFQLLFDPTKPSQHGEGPPMIAVMRILRLEQQRGARPRFPEQLADHVLGEVINEWQYAWYNSEEVTTRDPKKLRNAWFAHLKQRCGGTVWAKLLVQYGPDRMSDLLAAVLDARAGRATEQAPIMPVARAAMRQRGAV